jgi:hypothetical protein
VVVSVAVAAEAREEEGWVEVAMEVALSAVEGTARAGPGTAVAAATDLAQMAAAVAVARALGMEEGPTEAVGWEEAPRGEGWWAVEGEAEAVTVAAVTGVEAGEEAMAAEGMAAEGTAAGSVVETAAQGATVAWVEAGCTGWHHRRREGCSRCREPLASRRHDWRHEGHSGRWPPRSLPTVGRRPERLETPARR